MSHQSYRIYGIPNPAAAQHVEFDNRSLIAISQVNVKAAAAFWQAAENGNQWI